MNLDRRGKNAEGRTKRRRSARVRVVVACLGRKRNGVSENDRTVLRAMLLLFRWRRTVPSRRIIVIEIDVPRPDEIAAGRVRRVPRGGVAGSCIGRSLSAAGILSGWTSSKGGCCTPRKKERGPDHRTAADSARKVFQLQHWFCVADFSRIILEGERASNEKIVS